MPTSEAIKLAVSHGLDLVEISPNASPPVCKIVDYGKYKYEENRKERLAKKKQIGSVMKEVKFHANVEEHDYLIKRNHIRDFLDKGHRVKTALFFRGRENEHRELGFALFDRLIKDCADVGAIDAPYRLFGNNLVLMFRPHHQPKSKQPAPEQQPPPQKQQ